MYCIKFISPNTTLGTTQNLSNRTRRRKKKWRTWKPVSNLSFLINYNGIWRLPPLISTPSWASPHVPWGGKYISHGSQGSVWCYRQWRSILIRGLKVIMWVMTWELDGKLISKTKMVALGRNCLFCYRCESWFGSVGLGWGPSLCGVLFYFVIEWN